MNKHKFASEQPNFIIYLLTACLAGLLIMLRNPDPLFRPELWAEDGEIFFSDPFYFGSISVFYPIWSSFHLLGRLIAFLAAYAPSLYIPAIYAWTTFFIYIFVFLYFLRESFSYLLPSLKLRIIFILLMTTALGSWEVQMNLSNLPYLLAVMMAFFSLEKPIKSSLPYLCLWNLLSFSSPIFYVFLPFHFLMWFFTKNRGYLKIGGVLLVTFFISMINVIFHDWDHSSPVNKYVSVTKLDFTYLPFLHTIIFNQFFYGIHFIIPLGPKWFAYSLFFDWKLFLWGWPIMISALLAYCAKKRIYLELLLLCFCTSLIFSLQCIARNANDFFIAGKLIAYLEWNFRYTFVSGVLGVILGLSITYRCFKSSKVILGTMLSILIFYNVIFYTNHELNARPDLHWPTYAKQVDKVRDEVRNDIRDSNNQLPDMQTHRGSKLGKVKLSIRHPF